MRTVLQKVRVFAGATLLLIAIGMFLLNGGETLRTAPSLDDGFPLAGATPAKGASWADSRQPTEMSLEFSDFSEDLPGDPALMAYAVSDTMGVAGGAVAIAGLWLLSRRRPVRA